MSPSSDSIYRSLKVILHSSEPKETANCSLDLDGCRMSVEIILFICLSAHFTPVNCLSVRIHKFFLYLYLFLHFRLRFFRLIFKLVWENPSLQKGIKDRRSHLLIKRRRRIAGLASVISAFMFMDLFRRF
jgi:GT2 family glycosyltransferase